MAATSVLSIQLQQLRRPRAQDSVAWLRTEDRSGHSLFCKEASAPSPGGPRTAVPVRSPPL